MRHPVVAVLASWFVSLGGLQIASDATWKQIATPGYVFGALVLLGGALLGLNGDRPWGGSK